jgi:hypothetical protein
MNKTQSRSLHSKRSPNVGSPGPSEAARNAKQRYEHYLTLARGKALSGDRVEAENYYQHAEHYFRSAAALITSEPEAGQRR